VTERLSLWDVDDAVAFTAAIANRSGLNLSWSDREDLEQYLLVEIWRLSLRYERGDPQFPPRFSVYAAPCWLSERSTGSGNGTAARAGNSPAAPTSANDRGASPSTIPREIDWTRLTPRAMAIVRLVATSASQGWTATEIGEGLGTTRSWVSSRLDELRDEILRLDR
jgi:hypothetical protein